jgi:hypothetical protein
MGSSDLVGKRSGRKAHPTDVLEAADSALKVLVDHEPSAAEDLLSLKKRYAAECRAYYSVAALSRRRHLESDFRAEAMSRLFRLRSTLERAIISDLECCGLRDDLLKIWSGPSFFGVSAKQGVSVRYALASCVPTRMCGAGCYAHDGRDRELHHIFRGALNLFVGERYAGLLPHQQDELFHRLAPAIRYGVDSARSDQLSACRQGLVRPPRIRLSHVGEMAATPLFTNRLAREIRCLDGEVVCVIYTRHPSARELDSNSLVINFTLESDQDPRRAWIPRESRIVASAWNGELCSIAAVNFLEHHVEKVRVPSGQGVVCPVTVNHGSMPSCDSANCDLCFRWPLSK